MGMPGSLAWPELRFRLLGRKCVCPALLVIGKPIHVAVRYQVFEPRGLTM